MEAPDVELFNYFSLESHALQKLEQRRVSQLNVNFVLLIEKKNRNFWSDLLKSWETGST